MHSRVVISGWRGLTAGDLETLMECLEDIRQGTLASDLRGTWSHSGGLGESVGLDTDMQCQYIQQVPWHCLTSYIYRISLKTCHPLMNATQLEVLSETDTALK